MATAEELLASDLCDDILEVNLETRQIIIPDTVRNLGVESDDSVRILHFRVPRHYCEVDLSSFVIRINYKNTSGTGGVYSVSNPVVEDDTIKFDWIVARQVVIKKGDVLFNVCLREILDDVVTREFNTAIATLPVLEGLEMEEALIEPTYDYIEQLLEIIPTIKVSVIAGGHRVTITDKNGTQEFDVMNGKNGTGGNGTGSGVDGVTFYPSIVNGVLSWTNDGGLTNPTPVDITGPAGKDGRNGIDGKNGQDGYTPQKGIDYFDGKDGKDGESPIIEVTAVNDGHRITVINPDGGASMFVVADGVDGANGKDGISPTVSVSAIAGGHRVTIKDVNGTKSFDVMDGEDGAGGTGSGEDGVTFYPTIINGVLSWTNDGGLTNPDPVNVVGPAGKDGKDGADGKTPVKGTDYYTDADKHEMVSAVLSNFIDVSKEGQ